MKKAMPLVLTGLGAIGIGALWSAGVARLGASESGAYAIASGVLYGVWMAWESRISARERTRVGDDHDGHTMELAAAAKILLLVASLAPSVVPKAATAIPGLLLEGAGAVFRTVAIWRMGTAYGHRIRPLEAAPIAEGPYALIRHPAYLGTLVGHAGVALVFASWWSFGALALLWLPAVILRTVVEDRYLQTLDLYRAYAARVRARLIPGIW